MNITVYLGAHEGNDPAFKEAVVELATWISESGNRLVYGGSDITVSPNCMSYRISRNVAPR